jgi:hypothetical protein
MIPVSFEGGNKKSISWNFKTTFGRKNRLHYHFLVDKEMI